MQRADGFRQFYQTREGRLTANRLARLIAPTVRRGPAQRFLAMGYPRPLLTGLRPEVFERAAMLTTEGLPQEKWPRRGQKNNVAAGRSDALPFPGAMFDQLLAIHCLEHGHGDDIVAEWERVLAPAGELILVVPNRAGTWSSFERTPFGLGRPYGRGELRTLLEEGGFTVLSWKTALAAPPIRGLFWLEALLGLLMPGLGGVHLVLARKGRGPAAMRQGSVVHARRPALASSPQAAARAMLSRHPRCSPPR